mgnify:FL=1
MVVHVKFINGMKILVKDEGVYNGIYQVINSGSFTEPWVITRVTNLTLDSSVDIGEIKVKVIVPDYASASSIYPLNYFRNTEGGDIDNTTLNLSFEEGCEWVGNDYRINNTNLIITDGVLPDYVQMATKYRIYYRDLNECNNKATIGFLKHCKERPTNLNYSVEFCNVILPTNTAVQIPEYTYDTSSNEYILSSFNYRSILNEPYLYVRVMPINHAEGNLFSTNNPPGNEATFVVWHDKYVVGSIADIDPSLPMPLLDVSGTGEQSFPELNGRARCIVFKSCMITTMRLDLCAESWEIRIYDRFGRDLILLEENKLNQPSKNPPPLDRYKQTSIVLGIRPNYPI